MTRPAASQAAPLLLHVFPSFAVGGAQVRFTALANRFGANWRHAVVALDGDNACAERFSAAVSYRPLRKPYGEETGAAERLRRIVGLLRDLRPALLVTSNWGSIEWAIANRLSPRLPHLHLEDGFGPEERNTQLGRRVLARRVVLRRSTVVVPSTTLLRAAREEWRLPPARLRMIANGIDLVRFNPAGPIMPLDVPGPGPLIGTAAALRPEKNLERLLRALALLRSADTPARLAILGDGPQRMRLEALTAELGIAHSVRFLGHVADPAAAYRAMDLFCLSSDTEQMPFSLLEAMASGIAIAATGVGDVSAMLPHESRRYVTALADRALAEALRPLVLDRNLRAWLAKANRAKAESHFDQEAMFQAHAGLIDGLIRP